MIISCDGIKFVDVRNAKLSAGSHRRILCAKPSRPVSRLEPLELISFRTRVEENEVWNRAIQLSQLLGEHGAKSWTGKWRPGRVAPLKKINRLRMFAGACFHGANDCGPVGDGRTLGHEFAEVNSGDGSRDGSERVQTRLKASKNLRNL